MSALYSIGKLLLGPPLRLAWRPRITGLEHIPAMGPVILASNHLSVVDSILIPMISPRQVYFLAKDEYFQNRLLGTLMTGLNQISVDRSGGRASLLALESAFPVLRAGQVLGIYPEGTRSLDGRLYRGRPGVAKLAVETGATLVPIGIRGTERIQPVGASVPGLGKGVEASVGKPVDLSQWEHRPADSRTFREITAALMMEIAALSGQIYVGRYAPARRSPQDPAPEG
ncbi:MAG: 1-acyl-sn-glycerol-3-phosphate acyltransferase [Dactylosporangium sp.]|nr:1-acyl-sn-glycerol-3-phosphate acyltransferase [Dactylosporangium sp.]NNJ59580.1 1-acyl-sn-glycerol-3-phosphate acyltransferase [Dactylosporangium sp.]